MKKLFVAALAAACMALVGCSKDADVASRNISTAADNFEVARRVVFYNGITGEYLLVITGYCSKGNDDNPRKVTITCKTAAGEYKKHFLGLSDNVTYFIEHIDASKVSTQFYTVVFKPSTVVPSIDLR